jgi:hypothetical protein
VVSVPSRAARKLQPERNKDQKTSST